MPVLVAWLVSALGVMIRSRIGPWIAQALLFLGISYGVQKFAVGPLIAQIHDYVTSAAAGALLSSLGIIRFDQSVSIILSAYTVKYATAGLRMLFHKRV